MTGMTITAAIVAALCAMTILVFAGGGGGGEKPAPQEAGGVTSACQTAAETDCVQAAKDIVRGSTDRMPSDPAATGLP